jgi:hypothetical protein
MIKISRHNASVRREHPHADEAEIA